MKVKKLGDEGGAAHLVELIAVAQDLGQRDEIDGLGGVPELEQDVVDAGIGGRVEALRAHAFLDAKAADFARRKEEGAEDTLLRIERLWQ